MQLKVLLTQGLEGHSQDLGSECSPGSRSRQKLGMQDFFCLFVGNLILKVNNSKMEHFFPLPEKRILKKYTVQEPVMLCPMSSTLVMPSVCYVCRWIQIMSFTFSTCALFSCLLVY